MQAVPVSHCHDGSFKVETCVPNLQNKRPSQTTLLSILSSEPPKFPQAMVLAWEWRIKVSELEGVHQAMTPQ